MPTQQNEFAKDAVSQAMKSSGVFNPSNEPLTSATKTFGQKLVGIAFNPSNDDKVARAKQLCAELMDLVNDERKTRESSALENILYTHTVGEILNAQMNVVKLLTLKY